MEDINKNISEKRETPKFSYEVRNNGDVIFIKGGNEDQLFELAWQIFKKLDGSKFFHPSIKDGLKNGEDTRPQYGIYGIKFRKDHILIDNRNARNHEPLRVEKNKEMRDAVEGFMN